MLFATVKRCSAAPSPRASHDGRWLVVPELPTGYVSFSMILAIISAALYGAAMIFTKVGLRHMDAAAGALVSIPSTTVLYWLLAVFLLDLQGWIITAVAIFALVGLFYPFVVTLLVFESNRRMGPTVAGSVSSTTPLFATCGALVILGESVTATVVAGTATIVAGVMALSLTERDVPRRWPRWVVVLPLTAAAIRGLAQAATKAGLGLWANPFFAGLIGYTVSSAAVLGAKQALSRGRPLVFHRHGIPWFMMAGTSNGLALLAMYFALDTGRVAIVSPIVATYPLFTLILSALFLREEVINPRVVAGVVLTIAGVGILVTA